MGGQQTKRAIVRETNIEISVYKATNGNWIDYADCKTQYEEKDLIFINR